MADDDDRYQRVNLRLPRDLHAALMRAATERSRSMNAEIIDRLTRAFEADAKRPEVEKAQNTLRDAVTDLRGVISEAVKKLEALGQENAQLRQAVAQSIPPRTKKRPR